MKKGFINRLCRLAREDDRICLIVGDLGFSVVEPFAQKFPERFLNTGVAEQNMIGVATGWSLAEDKIVFAYSLGVFPTLRCLEQIRNDVCYHRANVKIVSVGAGMTYGTAGFTHFGVEDLAVMRTMPGMVVGVAADNYEAEEMVRLAVETPGPFFLSLGKAGQYDGGEGRQPLELGKPILRREGADLVVISAGAIVYDVLPVVELLREKGVDAGFLEIPFWKPLDKERIAGLLRDKKDVVVIEEHSPYGGLGAIVAEMIAESNICLRYHHFSLPEMVNRVGSQSDLKKFYGLHPEAICERIR